MTLKYFIKTDPFNKDVYSYCEGDDSDPIWDEVTCIEVERRPSICHIYNRTTSKWELDEEFYMNSLRAKRDIELSRLDKYMISDYPVTSENRSIIETYRQALRDCPNKEKIEDRVIPECPDICKE